MERFIQKVARDAGAAVLKKFGKVGVHYMKSIHRGDAVTKADLLSDKIIVSAIKKKYPDHGIISEESGIVNSEAEYVWTVDPIDGTFNFVNGVPLYGIMIALVHNDRVLLSAIYIPPTAELFFAKEGKGAFLNGKRIRCSQVRDWSSSAGIGPTWLRPRSIKFLENLTRESANKNMQFSGFGSIAIDAAYIASGRRDWVALLNGGIHDFAPAALLMREAGCTVTNPKGKPWAFKDVGMVAANPTLHKQLLKLTKHV